MHVKQVFTAYSGEHAGEKTHFTYCPQCATELTLVEKGGRHRPACHNCGYVQFSNPLPGVVILVEQDGYVLLGRRGGTYGHGKWGLPQGYIEFEEDFLAAAIREVKEETGLDVEIKSILNVVSNLLTPTLHTLVIVLRAAVTGGELRAGDYVDLLQWIPLSGPLPEMAFEADAHIIERYQKTNDAEGLPVDPNFRGPRSKISEAPR